MTITITASCMTWAPLHLHWFSDSQHGQPPCDVLPILQWILRGLSYRLPVDIETGAIDLQGFIVGHGSCGIAAYNFLEYRVDKQAPQWFATSSSLFWDKILSDLVIYHCIAVEAKVRSVKWDLYSMLTSIGSPFTSVPKCSLICKYILSMLLNLSFSATMTSIYMPHWYVACHQSIPSWC